MSDSESYSLHRQVWEGSLSLASIQPETELEQRDPHGRTALMLAVMLGRAEAAKVVTNLAKYFHLSQCLEIFSYQDPGGCRG